jgi:predicted helicase
MSEAEIEKLKSVNDFDALVEYLRDDLEWPIEAEDAEDITFDYNPRELGIDKKHVAKIKTVKQIRPLADNQPWGLFYIEFEPKKLPVVVLRRILRALIHSRRQRDDRMKTWDLSDLIFISSLGEADERSISFAHFSEAEKGLPELRTFSWDAGDTYFHYLQNTLDLDQLRWPANEHDAAAWREQWSSAFTRRHRYVITTSKQLAIEMARLAAQIRDHVMSVYDYEVASGALHKLYENFKKMLIHDLEIDTFADMYAQTIAYGLFSAKATHEGEFALEDISTMIPNTNPFLKNLFEECTRIGSSNCLDLDELGVTELVKMLKETDVDAILQDFGRQKRGEDPVIHFYEDFLREYDPEQKVKRGVFYTPDPVVSFIVRSVDYILRTEFDCPDGLADTSTIAVPFERTGKDGKVIKGEKQVPKVQILDPATGTGTFLKYVIEEIKKTFDAKHKELRAEELRQEWNEYVDKHLLPRVFGFELLMAPYAIAHLKLGLKLKETGYEFLSRQRLGVALTNSLESGTASAETLEPYLGWLAQESIYSNYIKTSKNISVVVGNPPYSVSSQNKGEWITELIEDYKRELNEKKISLDDDFIKFLRFGQWRIDKAGFGILAFITNHTFIDGLTHRRMRESLMKSFDGIYIMNLHGNTMKQEKPPIGGKDENVFDIQQGVSIGIFSKSGNNNPTKVYHTDVWGDKEEKYNLLLEYRMDTIKWTELRPKEPYFFFVSKDFTVEEEYNTYVPIDKIFAERSYGIQTKKDSIFIYFSEQELEERLSEILKYSSDPDTIREKFEISGSSGWSVEKLRHLKFDKKYIHSMEYRPFDFRKIYYDPKALGRARYNTMYPMLKQNLGLISMRQVFQDFDEYNHFGVSDTLIDERTFYSNRGGTYLFPLYLYPDSNKKKTPNHHTSKTPNLNPKFIKTLTEGFGTEPTPENIFNYIYALLHSHTYRKRYEEFLKIDFPRVPLTSNKDMFKTLSRLGSELVSLHLMKSPELDKVITEFKGEGDNIVAAIGKNSYNGGKLKINKTQYFERMPEEVYNFHIGGYQVCQKWLKDRKGRELTEEEIEHYQKIVVALNETIEIMEEIDEVIEGHGAWPVR